VFNLLNEENLIILITIAIICTLYNFINITIYTYLLEIRLEIEKTLVYNYSLQCNLQSACFKIFKRVENFSTFLNVIFENIEIYFQYNLILKIFTVMNRKILTIKNYFFNSFKILLNNFYFFKN